MCHIIATDLGDRAHRRGEVVLERPPTMCHDDARADVELRAIDRERGAVHRARIGGRGAASVLSTVTPGRARGARPFFAAS